MELAIRYSDGLVLASDAVDPAIVAQAEASGLPLLKHADTAAENAYVEFLQYAVSLRSMKRFNLVYILGLVALLLTACNPEYNNVGAELVSTDLFDTETREFPVYVVQDVLTMSSPINRLSFILVTITSLTLDVRKHP